MFLDENHNIEKQTLELEARKSFAMGLFKLRSTSVYIHVHKHVDVRIRSYIHLLYKYRVTACSDKDPVQPKHTYVHTKNNAAKNKK